MCCREISGCSTYVPTALCVMLVERRPDGEGIVVEWTLGPHSQMTPGRNRYNFLSLANRNHHLTSYSPAKHERQTRTVYATCGNRFTKLRHEKSAESQPYTYDGEEHEEEEDGSFGARAENGKEMEPGLGGRAAYRFMT
ncbi:hypothetical protein Trydic_g20483 [Trypoxylus dichotomus]